MREAAKDVLVRWCVTAKATQILRLLHWTPQQHALYRLNEHCRFIIGPLAAGRQHRLLFQLAQEAALWQAKTYFTNHNHFVILLSSSSCSSLCFYFLAGEKAERCTSQFAIVGFSVAGCFSLHVCKLRHIAWHLTLFCDGLRAFHESTVI